MPGYISSNENRFYVCAETSYNQTPPFAGSNRIPAVSLKAQRSIDVRSRKDKTGSRTYFGTPSGSRARTTYGLTTYMTRWGDTSRPPAYGCLFEAALGGAGVVFPGASGTRASAASLTFTHPHGLCPGQAVASAAEIRFVSAVANQTSVILNAPFSVTGDLALIPTVSYRPATKLKSFSLLDCWSPDTAVQRVVAGAGVDRLRIAVHSDYQEFEFTGDAADLIDSSSFTAGQSGLAQFPPEPADAGFDSTIVPGHLGQAWIGASPNQVLTLTSAEIRLDNSLDLRANEFGATTPRDVGAGERNVGLDFTIFAQDDAGTEAMYQAARSGSPVSVLFQLGEQAGEMCGVYMPAVVLETPEFDDAETRLQWRFRNARAQGLVDDELFIAFA